MTLPARTPPSADDDQPAEVVAVYRATVGPLYAYVARRSGGDRDLAEDVVQETYLRAIRSWPASGPPQEPAAWLRTVARNLLVSHARLHRPARIDPAEMDRLLGPSTPTHAVTPRAARLIHWGLARLNAGPARLLEAFHLDGKPVKSIAAETGLSERAVEGRLHRARRALRRELAPLVEEVRS